MYFKVLKYVFFDIVRSRWFYIYFGFYFLLASSLLFFVQDVAKSIITLMNIILALNSLIGSIFGVMYYYESKDFIALLLCQPIRRRTVFLELYLGVTLSLLVSFSLGLSLPFGLYGAFDSQVLDNFFALLFIGNILTCIFVAIAFYIGVRNENKVKGFGYSIVFWLFMSVIYDAIFLILLIFFKDYPLQNFSLIAVLANPVDLSRVFIILKLDIAALMGYTGANFKDILGGAWGMLLSSVILVAWGALAVLLFTKQVQKKDF